jgi:uncharacterized protein (TIGR02145 family)
MNKIVLTASLTFAIIFTLNACSSSDENGDNVKKYSYCVYVELRTCLSGPFETCANSGTPSDGCPIGYGIDSQPSSSSGGNASASGTFKDSRNNEIYKWVRIGNQVWMARNLNYRVNESNTVIGTCYNNSATNCDKYGRLYTWATAMALPSSCNSSTCSGRINTKHQGICPNGWHIPSDSEWDELEYYVGSSMAGWYLKATSGWGPNDNGGGDYYGFSALPGGSGTSADNTYYKVGESGHWWNHSEADSKNAHSRALGYDYDRFYSNDIENKSYPFSVRCVQD